ncbi:hypothetical protein BKA57DRAFT_467355 [Linnemannia elongata]|nr:hypothetical protein BKA57DRAFT_467355 [Linnemannia elongata]
MWNAGDKQDTHMLQRNMAQLSMDNMQSTPSSRMAEYHQQMQTHSQRNGPPGITRNTLNPSMIKSPPPGLESLARSDMGNWSGSQQQQTQQQQASSRINGWSNDNGPYNSLAFQDPAIMSARLPSSGATKASLMEALQNPMPSNGLNGYRMANGHDNMDSNHNSNSNDAISEGDKKQDGQQQQVASLKQQQQKQGVPDSPSSLQNFPLGSKRKEIKSVKGVLNSGMNAPLNGGSRSRPSSTPGSPLVEPRLQLSTQQQQQQPNSQAMNGLTSAAARSAKVKSDLLMGLNSPSIRSDRYSAAANMKDGSDGGQYDMNGYGQQHSPMMGSSVTGPPPGLGMPNGNSNNNTNHNNSGSPYSMSNLLGRQPESSQSLYGNTNGKPLDVATMMSALDFFGPGQASSLMMSPNWPMASGHSQQQQQQQQQQNQQQQHQQQDKNSGSNTSHSSPSLTSAAAGGATARSVEDLELQVINAKMETQMLENQLNAVIKRNRRKLYA